MNRLQITVIIVFFVLLSGAVIAYTFEKCGSKALLLGQSALTAAVLGMCDE